MYKVFIQNHCLRLSQDLASLKDPVRIENASDRAFWSDRIEEDFISGGFSEMDIQDDPDLFLSSLWNRFERIEAAGGRIHNNEDEVLMIYRLGHWDLPKGKIEPGESPEEAARREIEEECALRELILVRALPPSFHIYEQKGRQYLKKTYWFEYRADKEQELIPQQEEGIEKIEWLGQEQIMERKELIYPSLFPLLRV